MRLIFASKLDKSQAKIAPILKDAGIRSALCIPTAANVYAPADRGWQTDEMNALRQLGVELDMFDVEGKSPAEVQARLAGHTAVYVTGGNTYFVLDHMRRSGFDKAIRAWVGDGKTYIGCSAGAVVACPRIDYIGRMDDPSKSTLTEFTGLGLYPDLIMVHADHPKYGPIAQGLMTEWQGKGHIISPLNDDQVLVWDGAEGKVL
jgi:dipeptidase E